MAFGKKTRTGSEPVVDEEPWEGPTWQFATVTAQTNSETLLDRLNEMGQRGWQAVSMTQAGGAAGVMSQVLMQRQAR